MSDTNNTNSLDGFPMIPASQAVQIAKNLKFLRAGRRVLIDEKAFFEWLDSKHEGDTNGELL